MKNKYYVFVLAAGSLLSGLTGCTKKLDQKPFNSIDESVALVTSSDVEAALIGAYSDLGNANVYGGSLFVVNELLGNSTELDWTGTFETYTDIFNKAITVNNGQVASTWNNGYRVINDCNNVLSALDVVVAAKKNRVEGEAKFIRGSMYFDLVRLFGKAYNQGNPSQNAGVPIVLKATRPPLTDEDYPSRASVGAVYDQVIKDLTDAENLLPATNGFFASKVTAAAMLSRVYLQKGDYPNAAQAANRAISANRFSLAPTYADAFPYVSTNPSAVPGNTSEDVFAIQVSNTAGVNDFNTYFSTIGRGDVEITNAHLALYEPNDDWLNLFYDDGGTRTGKFDMVYGNVHIIRLAELYLTRAEANFRMSTAVGATPLADINRIRVRVNLDPYLLPADLTLDKILRERHLELAFEGFNLQDIKRTQKNVGILPWDSPKLVFPIPDRDRKVNKNLTQNEGYGN